MHLTVEKDGHTFYFKWKSHFDMMLQDKYKDSLYNIMRYATAALDPAGNIVKNRMDGYYGIPMYFSLYEYLKLTPEDEDEIS
jgi:hypothetical protein